MKYIIYIFLSVFALSCSSSDVGSHKMSREMHETGFKITSIKRDKTTKKYYSYENEYKITFDLNLERKLGKKNIAVLHRNIKAQLGKQSLVKCVGYILTDKGNIPVLILSTTTDCAANPRLTKINTPISNENIIEKMIATFIKTLENF